MRKRLNLMLFDGEGAAGGAPAEGAPAEGAPAEGAPAEGTPAEGGAEPEDRETAFERMIKGEYRDLYDANVQKIVKSRVADSKKMERQLQEQGEILSLVAKKYGISMDHMGDIKTALEGDEAFWEEAAAEQGMSVESYRRMVQLETENEQLREAKDRAERRNQKNEVFARWEREAEEVKRYYPDFDIQKEANDERFTRLMGAGIDMKTIYETLHLNEIMPGLMRKSAEEATKKQAETIKSGQMRPAENGMSSRPAAEAIKDPAKMTPQEREEYARRAAAGEIITFRE